MTTIDESYIPDIDYGDFDGEGSSRRAIFIILVAILVIAIGALAYWRLAVYKPGKQTLASVENTTSTYSLGAQTMNLSDGSLIQVTAVMHETTLAESSDITHHASALDNAEIFVFGSMNTEQALTNQGKLLAQKELLGRFNKILGPVNHLPQVQGVWFSVYQVSEQGAPVG